MQKVISLFKRDYKGTRQVFNEIVPGAEWVIDGEGEATVKYDGTCCRVESGKLFRRYDRKLIKSANRRKKRNPEFMPTIEHYKPAPDGWIAAEIEPNKHTGHWPGWLPVGDGPQDKWHREAFYFTCDYLDDESTERTTTLADGTYELLGPKIQGGNPYELKAHHLWKHGKTTFKDFNGGVQIESSPRDFDGLKKWFAEHDLIEGIVWHHPDGRMVKIKRRDFGLPWPVAK